MPGRGARSSDNMYLHLSIAQLTVLWPLVVGAGFAVGLLSGLFGVGGGFLISPILMFIGIPTEVAISSGANQSVATSASAAMAQWRLGNVDPRMSMLLPSQTLLCIQQFTGSQRRRGLIRRRCR